MEKLTVALPPELKSRAQQRALERGISLSELIREALDRFVQDSSSGTPDPLKPRSESPFFQDVETFDGDVPADLSARHDDRSDDPFFRDRRVFTGDVPPDLSANHDHYLYGDTE